jgi:hypothetical protein
MQLIVRHARVALLCYLVCTPQHGQIKLNAASYTCTCHDAKHTFMLITHKRLVLHAADQRAAFGGQSAQVHSTSILVTVHSQGMRLLS